MFEHSPSATNSLLPLPQPQPRAQESETPSVGQAAGARSRGAALVHTFVERSAKSVEDDINALTRIPNSMLRKMRVVPLSKSAEYVQAHTADGDENGCPTLLPPLILTDTGLKDKKQLFSFEGLRESCGLIPIMKPFGRKSSAAAEEDEGIMAVDEVCSCVTLDEYLSYTQDVKALYESCTPVPSSPQPLSSSQQQQLPSTLSASGDQNMGGSDNSAKDEKKVEPTEGTDTTTTTSTIISPGDLSNRLLYARNVICLSSWKAAINECFSGTPFAFNSPHNLFNTLPKEKRTPVNSITLDVGVPGTGFSPSFDLGYRICASLQHEGDGCSLWICTHPRDVDRALLCDTLMSITPDDMLALRKLKALARAATFPVYVGVVREGEAVAIPPGSVFMNLNFGGGRFSRAIWDVFTPRSVEFALMKLSPLSRELGLAEIYETKAMAYYGLLQAWEQLQKDGCAAGSALLQDTAALVRTLEIIVRENTASTSVAQPVQNTEKSTTKRVCQQCGCNLFSRGYQCSKCAEEDLIDGYVCIECAAEGKQCRNPRHNAKYLILMEFFPLVECTNALDLSVVAYKTVK